MMRRHFFKGFVFLGFLFSLQAAWPLASGGGCGDGGETPYDLEKHRGNVQDVAMELYDYLDRHVARAAIVARAGGDISENEFRNPARQKYTHAGIAWRSSKDALWRFKHVLNVCAGKTASIFVQSLAQFFNDGPHFYDFTVGYPSAELQEKMVEVLENDAAAQSLLVPRYSNIANPFRSEYQNSNGWVLSVIASAQSGFKNLRRVVRYYKDAGFRPSKVKVSWWKRFGSMFVDNATTEDHSREEKSSGWYNFVSAASLFAYLDRTDILVDKREICHPKGCNIPLTVLNN